MNSTQVGLDQLLTQADFNNKQRNAYYNINNSLKRNSIRKNRLHYDAKITQISYNTQELTQMLSYILNKDTIELPDRNWLRRLMLSFFDQEMIFKGGRQFINHLKLSKMKAGTCIKQTQKMFVFVLSGRAEVHSCGFIYFVGRGSVFGEKEILSNNNFQKIKFISNTIILTMSQSFFNQYFRHHFNKLYEQRRNLLNPISWHLQQIPQINQYLVLSEVQLKGTKPGTIIVQNGKIIDRVYFVNHIQGPGIIASSIGFYELLKGQKQYEQSVFNSKSFIKIPFIKSDILEKYLISYLKNNPICSFYKHKLVADIFDLAKTETKKQALPHMRVKKVRLSVRHHKLKTEPINLVQSQFKFFSKKDMGSHLIRNPEDKSSFFSQSQFLKKSVIL